MIGQLKSEGVLSGEPAALQSQRCRSGESAPPPAHPPSLTGGLGEGGAGPDGQNSRDTRSRGPSPIQYSRLCPTRCSRSPALSGSQKSLRTVPPSATAGPSHLLAPVVPDAYLPPLSCCTVSPVPCSASKLRPRPAASRSPAVCSESHPEQQRSVLCPERRRQLQSAAPSYNLQRAWCA